MMCWSKIFMLANFVFFVILHLKLNLYVEVCQCFIVIWSYFWQNKSKFITFPSIIALPVKIIILVILFLVLNICILVEITQDFISVCRNYFIFNIILVCFFRKLNLWVDIDWVNIEGFSPRSVFILVLKLTYYWLFYISTPISDNIIYSFLLWTWEGIEIKIEHFRESIIILTTINQLKTLILMLSWLKWWQERNHSFLTSGSGLDCLRYLSSIQRKLLFLETFIFFHTRIVSNSIYLFFLI